MFDLDAVHPGYGGSFTCSSHCKNNDTAEEIRAGFVGSVRQISIFADLYCNGPRLIVEAPDENTVIKIADILNHAVEW